MAQNIANDRDDEEDKDAYSSVTNQPSKPELSIPGQIQSTLDSGDDPNALDLDAASKADPKVQQYISQLLAGKNASSSSDDPLMQQYDQKEKDLQGFRQAQMQANAMNNIGQSFAQAAQGANAPVQNTALYKNIEDQNKIVSKGAEEDLDRRQKVTNAIEQRKSREQIAGDSQALRGQIASDSLAGRQAQASAVASSKADAEENKMSQALKDDLDPNKARGGNLASNQKRVDSADRVKALLAQVHNNPDPRQMEELAISTQSLLSNSGSPGAEQVRALIPQTALGSANKFVEWISNNPTGTGQQAFVTRMAETVDRERSLAQQQVQKAQTQRLSAHSKFQSKYPDSYNAITRSYGLSGDSEGDDGSEASSPNVGKIVNHNGKMYRVGTDGDSLEEVAM